MKISFTILLIFVVFLGFPQITTTKIAPASAQKQSQLYDSTQNFLGDNVYSYIGQEFYLNGMSAELQRFGYEGFTTDYTKNPISDKSVIYKCCNSFNSNYNDLVGKYFEVLDVIKHPKAVESAIYSKTYYIKLKEKASGDIVFFEYRSRYEHSFPFIVVGYFTKLKKTAIGKKEFIVRGKNWLSDTDPMNDITTGKTVSEFEAGVKWKCVDVSIEEKYFSLCYIIQNSKGEKIPLSIDKAQHTYWVFDAQQAAGYKKKFGEDKWSKILNGNVSIGMTKEMCELSWGKPQKINETVTAGRTLEQWVYKSNYLYFDNGILTTMQ